MNNKDKLDLTTYLSLERTYLANERTFLAYTRTSLALLAGGIAGIKFTNDIFFVRLGYIIVASTPFVLAIGVYKYRKTNKKLKDFNKK